tara:strand:+ start:2135 stop:2401 length:267 start_codon:yes stop_codon:yes gene_type:complete
MVDADALALIPAAGLVIIECVLVGAAIELFEGLGQAEPFEAVEGGAALRQGEGVLLPDFRIPAITVARDDIVIAGQDERFFQLERSAA